MNKQHFRVIFSKTLQRLVVVSELAKTDGKAESENSSNGGVLQKVCTLKPLVFSLFTALGFVTFSETALANTLIIRADKTAPKNQQPIVLQSANGIPQINIQTPNDKGLSHNKYSQFDVSEKGAILNNSRTNTKTQQAGMVQGNPYLARGEAKVILNEVNSNKPSVMKGYVEVAGKKADVIIANPSGLHCDGCGIINSDRVTLTTGKPEIKNGQVDNIKVKAGKVKVSGKGLDNSRVDYTEIISRNVEANAGIWSKKETTVITGKNTVKRSETDKKLQIIHSKQPLASEAKPQVAIDVGELGGMYSGKIHLIGTENGVGVRNAGHIGASAETLQIDSQGRIVNTGTLNAQKQVQLSAEKGIENQGKIENKQGDIQLKSNADIQNNGSVVVRNGNLNQQAKTTIQQSGEAIAKGNINYTAKNVKATTTSLIATGVEVKDTAQGEVRTQAKRSASGENITVKATEKATLQGRNLTPNQLSVSAKTINADNSQNRANTIKFSAEQGDLSANNAQFDAENLRLSTPKTLSTKNSYLEANRIQTMQNALNNDGGTWVQQGVEAFRLSMNGTLKNNGGTFYTPNDFYLNTGHIEQAQGRLLAGKNLTISAKNIDSTAGKMVAGQSLTIKGQHLINDRGLIQATEDLDLHLSGRFTNRQTQSENQGVLAFGKLQLNANQLDNTQGVLFTPNTAQFTLNQWTNTQGLAQANQGLSIQTKQLKNDGGQLISAQHLQLNVSDLFSQQKGSIGAKTLDLTAGRFQSLKGSYISSEQADIQIKGKAENRESAIDTVQNLNFTSSGLDNTQGEIHSQQATLHLDTQKQGLDNSEGHLRATNGITIRSGALINDRGAIQTESDLHIETHQQTLSNRETLSSDTGIVALGNLSLNVGDVDNTQGYLATQQHLSLTGQKITNDSGLLKASDSLSLSATDLQNHQGLIHSKKHADFTLKQSLVQQGGEINAEQLTLSATEIASEKGSLISAVEMAINLSGNLSNQQSRIQSQKQLTIQSGQINNQAGVINSQKSDVELNTHQQSLNNQQGEISAHHHLMMETGQIDNTAGLLYAGKDLHLNSHSQSVLNRDTARVSGGILAEQNLVLNTGNLDNSQGVVQAQRISANTTNISNQNGLFKAEQDFLLNATHLTNNAGVLHSNATFSLNLSGDLNQRNGQIGAEHFVLSAQNLVSQSQSLIKANQARLNLQDKLVNQASEISTDQDLTIQAGSVANNQALLQSEQGNLHLTSKQTLNNQQGQIVANGTAHIESDSLDNSNGLIQAERDLTLNSHTSKISNRHGSLLSRQNITIQSGALSNLNGVVQAENLVLNTQGQQLDNRQGILLADEQLSLHTGKWLNHEGVASAKNITAKSSELVQQNGVIQGTEQAVLNVEKNVHSTQDSQILGGRLNLSVQGKIDNQQSEIRALARDLTLQSQGLNNAQGIIAADNGNVNLNTQQQALTNALGTLSSGANLTVLSGDIDNRSGLIRSQMDMMIETHQGAFDNRYTKSEALKGVLSLGKMQLNTQTLHNQNGKIITNLAQTIQAQNLDNQQGKITALDSQKLSITERLDNRAGQISVSGESRIQAAQLDNQKGEIQADSFNLTTALNNQQGLIMTKSDQQLNLSEANNQQGLIKSILGSVQLVTNRTLNNNAGKILAKNRTNLTAYQLENRDGMIYAETAPLTLNIATAVNNQNGTLYTLNQLQLDSQQLNNQQGTIFAENLARITSNVVENQGNITSNGDLSLTSQTLNNAQGQIRSQGNFTLTAQSVLNNQAGLLESGKLLHISTPLLNNQNTKSNANAPTSGIIGSSLLINSRTLNNAQGGIYSRMRGELNVTELDNTQGDIRSQGDLSLRGDKLTINNQNGYLQANQKLELKAQSLSNDGDLSADDLHIRLKQDFSTGNHIHANSHLHLETEGTLTNHHQLYANQSVTLVAQDFTNQQNGRVSSENTTINVTNTVNNLGLINAISHLGDIANTVIRATQIINQDRIYGDQVALQADLIINQDNATSAPVIAARERLDLAAREIENRGDHYQGDGQVGSLLFSGGEIAFGRKLDENNQSIGEADTLRNLSSTIEAEGDIALNVKQVENINEHYEAIHLVSNQTGNLTTLVREDNAFQKSFVIDAMGSDQAYIDSKYLLNEKNSKKSEDIALQAGMSELSELDWVPYSRAGRYQWRADRVEPTLIEKDTVITEDMLLAGFHETLCENGECQAVQAGLYRNDSPIWAYFNITAPSSEAPAIPSREKPSSWYIASPDPTQPDIEVLPTKPTAPTEPEKADYQRTDNQTGKEVFDEMAYQRAVAEYEQQLQIYSEKLKEYQFYEQEFKPYDDWLESNQDSITKLEEKIEEHNEKWLAKHAFSPKYYDWFWLIHLTEKREDESKVLQSAPAQILSGGQLVANSQTIKNDKSHIIAGGNLHLTGQVDNIDDEGLHRVTFNGISQYSKSRWRGGRRRYFQRDWGGINAYQRIIETEFDMGLYRLEANTALNTAHKPTDINDSQTVLPMLPYQFGDTHIAQGNAYPLGDLENVKGISHNLANGGVLDVDKNELNTFSAGQIHTEKANPLLSDTAQIHTGLEAQLSPVQPTAESAAARRLNHFNLNDHQEVRTITPNLQLPNNRIYRLNSTPNSTVLVETDPDFTNEKRWLSSDYMFNALRVEPNQAQKRLGDGFYEQRLVREQINRLTGRQFLGNYTDFDSQYQALMNAGVTFAEKFNLRVGIALSPEQVANLTSDIVWLESESVTLPNGKVEQVLVPKVYALAQKGDITGKGALLSGNQVTHRSGELINSGTIAGRELVQLDSQNVKNTGTISGSAILGNITGDLANLGGTLEADRAILLNVGGNLTHSSTLHTTEVNNNGYQRSETTIGRKGLIHVKGKDGVLQLQSGGNFTVSGADIINDGQGQTYLSAKNQLNLTALQTGFDEKMGGGDHYRNQAIQDVNVSHIKGNGDVILRGGNIYSEGADIDAKVRLALLAENDIVLGNATRQTAFEEYHKTKSGSAVAKKTETRHANNESKTQIGTVLSADNIVLSAGQDVTASASQIVADNDIRIVAGNNVSITAGTNYFKDIYQESKKTSGVFTSGGLGITIGKRKENLEQDYTQQSAARTLLGSLSGNITIQADNHYQQTGSIITARDGNVDITAKSANITAARSDYESNYKRTTEQKGGTVAFSSPVTNTIQAVKNSVNSAKAVGSSKNNRINALGAVNAGFEAMRTAEQVGNLAKVLSENLTQALSQDVSVSITYGEQKSVETQHSEGNKVEKSQINAGGKVNINSEGDGKNSILTIAGSDVSGKGGTHLKAEGGVNMLAVDENHLERSQNKSSGFNAGVAISYGSSGFAFGVTAGGNVAKGYGNGESQAWVGSQVGSLSSQTTIESGGDANIIGSQMKGESVKVNAENLNIQSLQDTMKYEGKQESASGQVTVGYGFSASGSYSETKANSNYAGVKTQAGIFAGDEGYDVDIRNHTDLKGGTITSTEQAEQDGKNQFVTNTLTYQDVYNHSDYSAKGFGLNGGFSVSGGEAPTEIAGVKLQQIGENHKDGSSKVEMSGVAGAGSQGNWGVAKLATSLLGQVSDKGSENGITTASINTKNITIRDEQTQQQLTGKTVEETVKEINKTNLHQEVNKVDIEKIKSDVERDLKTATDFVKNLHDIGDDIYYNIEKKEDNIFVKEKRSANCESVECIQYRELDVNNLEVPKTKEEAEQLARMYAHGIMNKNDDDRLQGAIQYGGKDYLENDVLVVRKPYTSLQSELTYTVFERLRAGLDMPSIFGASNASREQAKVWGLLEEYNRNNPNAQVDLKHLSHSLGVSSSTNAMNWANYKGMQFDNTTLNANTVGTSYPMTNNTIGGRLSFGLYDQGYTEKASSLFRDGKVEYAVAPGDIVSTGLGLPYLPGSWSIGIGNTNTTGDNFPRIPGRILTGDHDTAYYRDKTVIDFLYKGDEREKIINYQNKIWGQVEPKTKSIELNRSKENK